MARPKKIVEIEGPWEMMRPVYTTANVYYKLRGQLVHRQGGFSWPSHIKSPNEEAFLSTLNYALRQITVHGSITFVYVKLFQAGPPKSIHIYRGTPEEIASMRALKALGCPPI